MDDNSSKFLVRTSIFAIRSTRPRNYILHRICTECPSSAKGKRVVNECAFLRRLGENSSRPHFFVRELLLPKSKCVPKMSTNCHSKPSKSTEFCSGIAFLNIEVRAPNFRENLEFSRGSSGSYNPTSNQRFSSISTLLTA